MNPLTKATALRYEQARIAEFEYRSRSIIHNVTSGNGDIKLSTGELASEQVLEKRQKFVADYTAFDNVLNKVQKAKYYENFAGWQTPQSIQFSEDSWEEFLSQVKKENSRNTVEAFTEFAEKVDTEAFAYIADKVRVGNVIGADVATTATSVVVSNGVATATFTVATGDDGFTPDTTNILNKGIQIGTDKEFYRIYEVTSVTSQVVVAKIKTDYNIAEAIYEGEAQTSTTGVLRGAKSLAVTKDTIFPVIRKIKTIFSNESVDTRSGVTLVGSPELIEAIELSDAFYGQKIDATYRGIIIEGYFNRVAGMDVFESTRLPVDTTTGVEATLAFTRNYLSYERRVITPFEIVKLQDTHGWLAKALNNWFVHVKPLSNKGAVKLLLTYA